MDKEEEISDDAVRDWLRRYNDKQKKFEEHERINAPKFEITFTTTCSNCGDKISTWSRKFLICGECLFQRAEHALETGYYLQALELHREGIIFDATNNNLERALLHLKGSALAYQRRGNNQESEYYFRECFEICLDLEGDLSDQLYYLGKIREFSVAKNDYVEIENISRKMLEIERRIGDRLAEARSIEYIASSLLNSEEVNTANPELLYENTVESERLYRQAVRIFNELNIPLSEWYHDNGYTNPDSYWEFPPGGKGKDGRDSL